jgi:hypothetical protein
MSGRRDARWLSGKLDAIADDKAIDLKTDRLRIGVKCVPESFRNCLTLTCSGTTMQDLGLSHLWSQGDIVIRAAGIILLIVSVLSWIVILTKAWDLIRLRKMAQGAEKRFWQSDDFDHALNSLGANDANPFRTLAIVGREAAQHHRASQPQMHDALDLLNG